MIYLVGGAPRTGKSILGQRLAAGMRIGWISTDLLMELLRVKRVAGAPYKWDATPIAIRTTAEWFYPYLERFIWGVTSQAKGYVIEGVGFLPGQIRGLSSQYPIRAIFLGCSSMTLERFDRFPGRSRGYSALPKEMRRQFAEDVPLWSEFIRQESAQFDCPYIDTGDDFPARLDEAEAMLASGAFPHDSGAHF